MWISLVDAVKMGSGRHLLLFLLYWKTRLFELLLLLLLLLRQKSEKRVRRALYLRMSLVVDWDRGEFLRIPVL
jgi:hypothetical protein